MEKKSCERLEKTIGKKNPQKEVKQTNLTFKLNMPKGSNKYPLKQERKK
jgi:hypothetical protein